MRDASPDAESQGITLSPEGEGEAGPAWIGLPNHPRIQDGQPADNFLLPIPTVSPAKNSLVYFISIAYIDRPVLRGHCQEAKRGEAGGHRITRNCEALGAFLLTRATTELSLSAMWCLIGATPRGQPWTSAVTLPQGAQRAERAADGDVVYISRVLSVSPRASRINAQRGTQFDPYNTRNCLPPNKLRREIQ